MAEVDIGGKEGGPTDVGLPPGVKALVKDIPRLLWVVRVSTD